MAIYTQFGDDIWTSQDRIQTESNSLRLSVACYGIIFYQRLSLMLDHRTVM